MGRLSQLYRTEYGGHPDRQKTFAQSVFLVLRKILSRGKFAGVAGTSTSIVHIPLPGPEEGPPEAAAGHPHVMVQQAAAAVLAKLAPDTAAAAGGENFTVEERHDGLWLHADFGAPLTGQQLQAVLRSVRRWLPRSGLRTAGGCLTRRQAAARQPELTAALQRYAMLARDDREALQLFCRHFFSSPGSPAAAEAQASGVASLKSAFPYLEAFNWSATDPYGLRQKRKGWGHKPKLTQFGVGDLLLSNGCGVFAVVEAKDLTTKNNRNKKRQKAREQAQRYGEAASCLPQAALVLPFVLEAQQGVLRLVPVDHPQLSPLSSQAGYHLLLMNHAG